MLAPSPFSDGGDPLRAPIEANGWLPEGYRGATITDRTDLREAAALYTRVFGYDDPALTLNPHLLMSLARNGGTSVGVFDEHADLVGYAYGFAGNEGETHYQFSQAAVVDARVQSLGIGKALKQLQARVAAEAGSTQMRWTFDPLLARNAHFNLNSLGATGFRFLPEYYGSPASDRILVCWELPTQACSRDHTEPPPLTREDWGRPQAQDADVWLAIPSSIADLRAGGGDETVLRASVSTTLSDLFADGRILTSCVRVSDDTAAYRAVRERGANDGR